MEGLADIFHFHIFPKLSLQDLFNVKQTCKKWCYLVESYFDQNLRDDLRVRDLIECAHITRKKYYTYFFKTGEIYFDDSKMWSRFFNNRGGTGIEFILTAETQHALWSTYLKWCVLILFSDVDLTEAEKGLTKLVPGLKLCKQHFIRGKYEYDLSKVVNYIYDEPKPTSLQDLRKTCENTILSDAFISPEMECAYVFYLGGMIHIDIYFQKLD